MLTTMELMIYVMTLLAVEGVVSQPVKQLVLNNLNLYLLIQRQGHKIGSAFLT
jgi:hypothetical protein